MVRHNAADLSHQVLSEAGTILWERALQLATRRMDITALALEQASKFTRSGKGHARNVNAVRDWHRSNNRPPMLSVTGIVLGPWRGDDIRKAS